MRRTTHAILVTALLLGLGPTASARAQGQVLHDRLHTGGATLLRFHHDKMHAALILDAVPTSIAERVVVLSDGRTIDFRWSGRSLWIGSGKYELPFGAVFLVSTKDSVSVKQLEFKAVRSRVILDQMQSSADVAGWVAARGDTADPITRQDIEASTMPRYTLEVAEWKFGAGYALTCILSGEPQFVMVSDVPVTLSGSGSTTFGGFDYLNAWVGTGDEAKMWKSKEKAATFGDLNFDYANGRVFLHSKGGSVQQVNTPLTLSGAAADALADEIERLTQVRAHLGLE